MDDFGSSKAKLAELAVWSFVLERTTLIYTIQTGFDPELVSSTLFALLV